MISLSAPTFDINGHTVSHTGVAIQQSTGRRSRRVATLDGSAVMVDGGYSTADLTFDVQIPDPQGTHFAAINRLMQFHATAILSCTQGCYLVLLSGLSPDERQTFVTAIVLEVV